MVVVDWPSGQFDSRDHIAPKGQLLYRVLDARAGRQVTDFNPGRGAPTRFAFFEDAGGEVVPVLYAASTDEAAVCETLIRDVPLSGGALLPDDYRDKVLAGLRPTGDLRLVSFMGVGLRALGTTHQSLTSTDPLQYPQTVQWAQAAHAAGYEGAAWMSNRCNDAIAVVLFGDRVAPNDLVADADVARIFSREVDRTWLSAFCLPMNIEVRW